MAAVVCACGVENAVDSQPELVVVGGASASPDPVPSMQANNAVGPNSIDPSKVYVSFIINIHDWLSRESKSKTATLNSYTTLTQLIAMHEKARLHVDFYMTDKMVRDFQESYPTLIDDIKKSNYVAMNYLVRAPNPYYRNADGSGYYGDGNGNAEFQSARGNDAALYNLIWKYESYGTDMLTGLAISGKDAGSGGYAYATKIFGYAPYTVTGASTGDDVNIAAGEVYQDMGATLVVDHNRVVGWKETSKSGLTIRPETETVRIYEGVTSKTESDEELDNLLILAPMAEMATLRPDGQAAFLNYKVHDNDFVANGAPWDCVYYQADTDGDDGCHDNSSALAPSYDPANRSIEEKDAAARANIWARYQHVLDFYSTHRSSYSVVNAKQLACYAGRANCL